MDTNTTIDLDALEVSEAVLQALLEIPIYQSSHIADKMPVESVEALVAAGALSPQTFARIGNHQSWFHGFRKPMSQDIAVFDVLLADKTPPLHFVGFADGHVENVDTVRSHPRPDATWEISGEHAGHRIIGTFSFLRRLINNKV